MIAALRLSDIAATVGGEMHGEDQQVLRVCTDTRALQPGDLFVALSGMSFDGNNFVGAAKDAGATAALLSRYSSELPSVVVADTRLALGQIARENRRQYHGPLIALTGSSGKTSTKEMLAAILAEECAVYATRGNLNNEIGVPLSLLEIGAEHQAVVIEMGAAKRGDIQYLCDFAEPNIAILTNAQPAHIAGFGSLDNVATTKGEIFAALPRHGTAVINADDKYSEQWQQMAAHCQRRMFSLLRQDVDVFAWEIRSNSRGECSFILHCELGEKEITLPLPGRHMVANALAAATAAIAAGASLDAIRNGLQALEPVAGRLSRKELHGISLINDSYNANPGSVKAAIDVLASAEGRRILVLGAMAELGENAEAMHREVAGYAALKNIDGLFVVGEYAELQAANFGAECRDYKNKAELISALKSTIREGDVVLIKGSRSAAMETVYEDLLAHIANNNGGEGS